VDDLQQICSVLIRVDPAIENVRPVILRNYRHTNPAMPRNFPLATSPMGTTVGKRPVGAIPVPRGVFTFLKPSPV
jgi:hypothetical protein